MLARLGIRQKLVILLAIPLLAVIATAVPYVLDRVNTARSARDTADLANAAREVGALVQNLQQERLLALGLLCTTTLDRSAYVARVATSADDAVRLSDAPGTRDIMASAAGALDVLRGVREQVLDRSIGPAGAYSSYRKAITGLLTALRLTDPRAADAAGVRQLEALESLVLATEEASSVGAVVVILAGNRAADQNELNQAQAAHEQYTARFRQLAPEAEIALVDAVEGGQAARQIAQYAADVRNEPSGAGPTAGEALTAAVIYTDLRRIAQDRVARQVAVDADARANAAARTATLVGVFNLIMLAVVIALGALVSRSISRPLRRLTRTATVVANQARAELVRVADSDENDDRPPALAAVDIDSAGEIGELADALNRVQVTAALMLERQNVTRQNTAVMFANIARRTQNLVGRQLALIEDLERHVQTRDLLARLQRLDHVATRLRRSADSLLVVSGTIDASVATAPTMLTDVVHAALDEIEGYRSVSVGSLPDVAVSIGLAGDLRLLVAELLENAASFSPPNVPVRVHAELDDECRIFIVDKGLGMTAAKLAEENKRLLERERLDLAPTRMLGLVVVGRLARRHGLTVRLEPSPGTGVTAMVSVPVRLLASAASATRAPRRLSTNQFVPAVVLPDPVSIEPAGHFAWFAGGEAIAIEAGPAGDYANGHASSNGAAESATTVTNIPPRAALPVPPPQAALPELPELPAAVGRASVPSDAAADLAIARPADARSDTGTDEPDSGDLGGEALANRGGLSRRVPGTHLHTTVRVPEKRISQPRTATLRPVPVPESAKTAAPAASPPAVWPPIPTQRTPMPSDGLTLGQPVPAATKIRDPEAERAELNDFFTGLARGEAASAGSDDLSTLLPERHT